MRHAVIMAGGAGTRLWPLSRRQRPKQLLKLFGGRSLLRESFERLARLMKPESIYVITVAEHLPMVAKELPELPEVNLLGEPMGRDTANAVGLSAAILHRRDPDAVMGIFTADHIITPIDEFCMAVDRGYQAADEFEDALITFGITPTRPDTNYGYVQRGPVVKPGIYEVRQFTEKPDERTARNYLAGGEHLWNSGMFAWRTETILGQIEKHMEQSYEQLLTIAEAWDGRDREAALERIYPGLEKISIDFAVMEKADRVLMAEMNCQWLDVGTWPALGGVVKPDAEGNVEACQCLLSMDSTNNIVVCEDDHLIAVMGIDDLIIVRSPDATLICTKEKAAAIKELVQMARDRFGEQYT